MNDTLFCLVDPHGRVYVKDRADSFLDVAREFDLTEPDCQEYRFDLATRRLHSDRGTFAGALAVQEYLNQRVGSPERLMTFAQQGHLPKHVLADLLQIETRKSYLDACAAVERRFTASCTAQQDPCLESGCSVEGEDEICLQPLLRAGVAYHQECAAEWVERFQRPANRIDAWKN